MKVITSYNYNVTDYDYIAPGNGNYNYLRSCNQLPHACSSHLTRHHVNCYGPEYKIYMDYHSINSGLILVISEVKSRQWLLSFSIWQLEGGNTPY